MRKGKCVFSKKGFTLMELLMVVVIISMMAALLIPLLIKSQARAQASSCLSKGRSIATALRTYTVGWGGFTPSDPESFLTKEYGYHLAEERGYNDEAAGDWYKPSGTPTDSQEEQAQGTSMRCPIDEAPWMNKHGLPMSYSVTSAYSGRNISNLTSGDTKTIIVAERGRRHTDETGRKKQGFYIYGDLHAVLGPQSLTDDGLPLVPGLNFRAWHSSSAIDNLKGVAESRLPTRLEGNPPFRFSSIWSNDLRARDQEWLTFLHGYSYDNDWNLTYHSQGSSYYSGVRNSLISFPQACTIRMDGLIKFPAIGIYEFYLDFTGVGEGGASVAFALGTPGDVLDPTNFNYFTSPNERNLLYTVNVTESDVKDYYPIQLLYQINQFNGGWEIIWTRTDPTTNRVDLEIRNVPVSSKFLVHIPQ
tara:strand:+ start:475 stop:1728 length:1254 start_codon:yes stop_codon:yes gene_type:complete